MTSPGVQLKCSAWARGVLSNLQLQCCALVCAVLDTCQRLNFLCV